DFIPILERTQKDMTFEIVRFAAIRLVRARRLLVQRFDLWRQQAMKAERGPLFIAESGAFVEDGCIQ
ncbi:MAG: hypothetical protein WB559_13435, partial [Candidatus Acidiferrales bacterium]